MFNTLQLIVIFLLSNQIMDKRELKYVFINTSDLISDMKIMSDRINNLKDVDSVEFAYIFPPRWAINEYLLLNKSYRQFLGRAKLLYPGTSIFQDTIEEVDYLYTLYDKIRDAQCEYYYIHIRREALKEAKRLLDQIDPTWYEKGTPPTFYHDIGLKL